MESLIRKFLSEAAEEVALSKEPVSATPVTGGEKMSDKDFTPAPPAATSGGLSPLPNIATGQAGPSTINKEILNKQLVLSNIIVLKNIVSTFEKQFEGEELSVDDAKIYIHSFLQNLATQADNIASLVGEEMGTSASEEMPLTEEPPMEAVPESPLTSPEPTISPELGAGTEELPPTSPELSEPVTPEVSPFTSPTEAI